MTRGADMTRVLKRSLVLAALCILFTIPYFHHLIFREGLTRLPKGLNPQFLLGAQLFLLFILCFLAALVGFSFSKRFELPGLGNRKRLVRSIPFLVIAAATMGSLSYLLFDRHFARISPRSYPGDLLYLVTVPFKEALTDETILRLCLVTLGVGLLKRRIAGVVLASVVASMFKVKYFHFIGMTTGLGSLFVMQMFLSFAFNVILGYLFVTYGLLFSMVLRLLLGIKYCLVAGVLGV